MAKELLPSNQIVKIQTNRQLIAMRDKLCPAAPECYAHLHADGEEINGVKTYSRIGIVMLDYTNGKGENTVQVKHNISPAIAEYLFRYATAPDFHFYEIKTFGQNGNAQYTSLSIDKYAYTQDGQPNEYPWFIKIANGYGVLKTNAIGGQYIQKGSQKENASVTIRVSDKDYFMLLAHTCNYIHVWEAMMTPTNIQYGINLYQSYLQQRILDNRPQQQHNQSSPYDGYGWDTGYAQVS